MNLLLKELDNNAKYSELIKKISIKKSPVAISGLSNVSEVELMVHLQQTLNKPILLITYNEIQAQKLLDDFKFFTDKVYFFPKKEIVTYDYIAESKNLPYERIEVLNQIYKKQNIIVITSIECLKQKMITKDALYKNVLKFKVGDICNLENLKQKLVDLGYQRFELIDGRGEFSIRGGIVDVSLDDTTGVRIELWGDEIDSIRKFNIISQRSIEQKEEIEIYPAHEYVLDNSLDKVVNNIQEKVYSEELNNKVENDIEQIINGEYLSKIDKYFDSFYEKQETIYEYMNENSLILIDEYSKAISRSKSIEVDNQNTIKALIEKERIVPESLKNYVETEVIEQKINNSSIIYLDKLDNVYESGIEIYHFDCKELNYFKSEMQLFVNDMLNFKKQNLKIYIIVDTEEKAKKVQKILEENNILSIYQESLDNTIITKSENTVYITLGKLSEGFISTDFNQILIDANELIETPRTLKKRKNDVFNKGEKVVFADLKLGDYVVHRKYGIGIYIGVNTLKADGITRDYIKIKYQGDDILYIPTNSLDEIRKYIGAEETNIKLNKLGSKDWERTKNKVKNNLRAVAKELIELYVKREKARGHAFSQDTDWQRQFEGAFEYVETDDQLRCIEEVKKDMESERPMDRLLCGDVGYRKNRSCNKSSIQSSNGS